MRAARLLAVLTIAAGLASAVGAATATAADARAAQAAPTAPPEITAIVSPIAAPACSAAGTATLLVPILGGVVQQSLALGTVVNIGDVVLDALGPVYIVCGTLPSPPGTRCSLDDQIAGVWPAQLGGAGAASPVIVGNVVDAVAAIARTAGVPAELTGAQVLQCAVPAATDPVAAPPAPSAAPARPATSAPGGSAAAGSAGGGTGSVGSIGASPTNAAAVAATRSKPSRGVAAVVDSITRRVPGGILFVQVLLALLLAAFLAGSWSGSWRTARRAGGNGTIDGGGS